MQFAGKIEPAAGAIIVGLLPLTSSCSVIRMSALESCRRGNQNVLPLGAFGVRVGAPPGRCGLHALPRPTARQPIAGPGDRTFRRTAVTADSPAARARILTRSRTRFRMGGQASGAHSSRRADIPHTE